MREFINIVEDALREASDDDLERIIQRARDSKIIHRNLEDLPPFLFHGTSLAAALDILSSNRMDVSAEGRDKGPRGVSFTREYEVAQRFASLQNQGRGTFMKEPIPGAIMRFNTAALFAMNHPVVRYKGGYASREKEERVLGVIQPVIPCIEHIGFNALQLSAEEVLSRVEHIVDGTNGHTFGSVKPEDWNHRLEAMKQHWGLFR